VQGVLDARLLLFHLGLGVRPDLDDGHAADQLGQPLLQLLAVVVGLGVLDLSADLLHARFDVGLLAGAVDHRGVVLVDGDVLGAAEILERDVLELEAEILGDGLAAGEGGEILEHLLAAIAEAGRLDRAHLQGAAQLVHDQRGQRLALDVLGHDQ
jgi:hypothetical protein